MIIKVCGIKYRENLLDLLEESVDMIGFNFYPESVRYVDDIQDVKSALHLIPNSVKKVGVFVNADSEEIMRSADRFSLDYIQLHGDESPEQVEILNRKYKVIKVFRVDKHFDFESTNSFIGCPFFLFDTRTSAFGGSGRKFDWNVLSQYKGTTPFLLSGGIGPEDVNFISEFSHPAFVGIDINSKFEYSPAMKDIKSISEFIYSIKTFKDE